ncbi:MAG: hypothetical protein ACTSX4_02935 [Candidatus Helarchaeota archaeon]
MNTNADSNYSPEISFQSMKFSDMQVGDRVQSIAKIINIKKDEKHDIPYWYLLYLFDGSKTIRVFLKDITSLKIGDVLEIGFSVKEGKPFHGRPQFEYNIEYVKKSEVIPNALKQVPVTENQKPIGFLKKEELKNLQDGQKVKLYTRIITLSPRGGEREKNQKILITDIKNAPISLWTWKDKLPLFKEIKEMEYFLLFATLKKAKENQNVFFLSFDRLVRGKEALKDEIAKKFIDNRIKYYSEVMLQFLNLRKENFNDNDPNHDMLISMLESYRSKEYGYK